MILEKRQYVTCLRWKQGEYQAVMRLSPQTKASIRPLIEVPEIGYDFATQQVSKSIDDHLGLIAKRVSQKWGTAIHFIDFKLLDPDVRMADGRHPVEFLLSDLRNRRTNPIPVVRQGIDADYQRSIRDEVGIDSRGVCMRVELASIARPGFRTIIDNLLEALQIPVEESDFIIDLEAPNFEPIELLADLLTGFIKGLPYRDRWRSFVIIGTSFPASMAEVRMGFNVVPRYEWLLYWRLVEKLEMNGLRVPNFGDYAINHPQVLHMDMRHVKPSASLRYTISNNWLIEKGENVRDHGYNQYQQLCNNLINSSYFAGREFSKGDEYIDNCAQGRESTGNLTTWRWVGTNHHIEKIVADFATQVDS